MLILRKNEIDRSYIEIWINRLDLAKQWDEARRVNGVD